MVLTGPANGELSQGWEEVCQLWKMFGTLKGAKIIFKNARAAFLVFMANLDIKQRDTHIMILNI